MARPLRILYPGAIYHVMNRGTARNDIFFDEFNDRLLFKEILGKTTERWRLTIHAYSLMPNHYHLLVTTPLANLSQAMRHIDGLYTQSINKKYKRDGSLFRGRFKSILVQRENYFLELVRYIHLNGVRAGLSSTPSNDITCSHPHYMRPDQAPPWLNISYAKSLFAETGIKTLSEIDKFVISGISKEVEKTLSSSKWPAILGSKDFIREIKSRFNIKEPTTADREIPQQREIKRINTMNPEEILKNVCPLFKMSLDEGKKRLRQKWSRDPFQIKMIFELREKGHMSNRAIGQWMGDKTESAIRYIFKQHQKEGIKK